MEYKNGEYTHIQRKENNTNVPVQRRQGEAEYLIFPMLEETGFVSHLITTRLGGVSEGYLASMNVSFTRGDKREAVEENYRRISKILKNSPENFVFTDQTHTSNIRTVNAEDAGKGLVRPKDYTDVDGLVTNVKGLVLSAFFADCVPLLFLDPVHQAIGLSHSGWRGTVAEIGRKTVEEMKRQYGSRPEDILAAIGPSICQDCYEVSQDVVDAVRECFSQEHLKTVFGENTLSYLYEDKGNDKYQLNLWKVNEAILLGAGILPEHISVTDICTCCNPDYLFSHRASHGKRGNIGAFISLNF